MQILDPQALCPCKSGRQGAACCVFEVAPVSGIPIGFDRLRMSMEGMHLTPMGLGEYVGFSSPVPPNLSLTTTLKNPHQLDEDVEAIQRLLLALLTSARGRGFDEKVRDHLWDSLEENLYAARYHQRQYLFRHRLVHEQTLNARISGSRQIEIIFSDVPLKAELEAVVLRSRSTLDTVGAIGLRSLGKSGDKLGAFLSFVQRNSERRTDRLREICSGKEQWLSEAKKLRDAITHGSNVRSFRGIKAGVAGVDPARLERDDASEYVLAMWRNLTGFVSDILQALQESG